jgi:hypothetical protein
MTSVSSHRRYLSVFGLASVLLLNAHPAPAQSVVLKRVGIVLATTVSGALIGRAVGKALVPTPACAERPQPPGGICTAEVHDGYLVGGAVAGGLTGAALGWWLSTKLVKRSTNRLRVGRIRPAEIPALENRRAMRHDIRQLVVQPAGVHH